jgi:hypothetical protein
LRVEDRPTPDVADPPRTGDEWLRLALVVGEAKQSVPQQGQGSASAAQADVLMRRNQQERDIFPARPTGNYASSISDLHPSRRFRVRRRRGPFTFG